MQYRGIFNKITFLQPIKILEVRLPDVKIALFIVLMNLKF